MKICPKCRTQFGDDLYFCLEDGSTLKDYNSFDPENPIAETDMATLLYHAQPTGNQNDQTNRSALGKSARRSGNTVILIGVFALILLLTGGFLGGLIYFRQYLTAKRDSRAPSSEPNRSFTPFSVQQTPQPTKENIKVEILEKVENNVGQKFLKCRVTNLGETTVSPYSLSLMFYKDDVKMQENSAFVKLRYLKPQQSILAWVGLYGTDNYTSVKVKEPISTFSVRKTDEQLFPKLSFTETKMETVYSTSYTVGGIIENQDYEKMSPRLYIVFYDEKSEVVGVETTRLSDLQKGEKTKFEAAISERDLFGKPKSFEIIPINE